MNLKQKIVISLLTITIILSMNFIMIINSVKAANLTEISQIELHSRGMCGQLLKYKGIIVKTAYVEYTYNGKSYPAYCLDKSLTGISSELAYSVGINRKIEDLGLWRTLINGYPYKTLSELGVANEEEAFTATKQAVYCYLFENTPSDYEAIGEAGQRTLNALNLITSNAEKSKEVQGLGTVTVIPDNNEWTEDTKDKKYVSKVYKINSNISHMNYEITTIEDMPEGSKITNLDGEEIDKFYGQDKFKIMLLKDKLNHDGTITLNIKTEVKTKPVIYGASPNSEWQNYALTGYMYEDATCKFEDIYRKIEKPEEPENITEIVPKPEKKPKESKILPVTGM